MIKPRKLRTGDRIAAISLSWGGPGAIPHRYQAGRKQFEDAFGVEVVPTSNALRDPAWLWRNPQARADDLMEAFSDPAVRGIVSTIGGDDSLRIAPYVRPEVIAANPKVFLGYSDTTVAHLLCFQAGLVSFYGPSIMAGFGESGGLFPYMVESVRRTIFSSSAPGVVAANTDGWTVEHLDWNVPELQHRPRALNPSVGWRFLQGRGTARGRLVGGCLEVLDWLRGTSVWPPRSAFEGAILFLETSEQAPPPDMLEATLRTFASMGILPRLAGLLVGRPGGGVPIDSFHRYDDSVLKVVAEEEGLSDLPVITQMDFGHTDPVFVLPYGVMAQIDCDTRQLAIVENAVIE